mgnify:FL=1
MKIGFDLIIDEDNSVQEQEEAEQSYYGQLKRKTIVAWIFALPVAVLGMFLMNVPGVTGGCCCFHFLLFYIRGVLSI